MLYFSSEDNRRTLARKAKLGTLKRLNAGIYSDDLHTPSAQQLRDNIMDIISNIAPGSILSHASAPAAGGKRIRDGKNHSYVFLTGADSRRAELKDAGIIIDQQAGPGPLPGDIPVLNFYMAGDARNLLEHLGKSRPNKDGVKRVLGREEVEKILVHKFQVHGRDYVNSLRDEARTLAPDLGAEKEAALLDQIVGALQNTRKATLQSSEAKALSQGSPYDASRIKLFSNLIEQLEEAELPLRFNEKENNSSGQRNAAFFDAYFSNYIEGTRFEVDEASKIVFEGVIPPNRPADGHDVLGTYRVLTDPKLVPADVETFESWEDRLKETHRHIMVGRPEAGPGLFKEVPNRAGGHTFVLPPQVRGTLKEGFKLMQTLNHPLKRAIFTMFLVAEVHPFNDGNGRTARAMMNAELKKAGLARILVPNVYRNEYLNGLRALSNAGDGSSLISVLNFAQRFSERINWADYGTAKKTMEDSHAFKDEHDEQRDGRDYKLKLPAPQPLRARSIEEARKKVGAMAPDILADTLTSTKDALVAAFTRGTAEGRADANSLAYGVQALEETSSQLASLKGPVIASRNTKPRGGHER